MYALKPAVFCHVPCVPKILYDIMIFLSYTGVTSIGRLGRAVVIGFWSSSIQIAATSPSILSPNVMSVFVLTRTEIKPSTVPGTEPAAVLKLGFIACIVAPKSLPHKSVTVYRLLSV